MGRKKKEEMKKPLPEGHKLKIVTIDGDEEDTSARTDNDIEEIVKKQEFSIPSDVKNDINELIRILKETCYKNKVPMFVSYVTYDGEGKTEYHNDVVFAATEQPEYGRRIADLLVSAVGADTKYPEYIQNAINTLQAWLDNEKTFEEGRVLSENRFRDYIDIADGLMVPTVVKDYNEEELEVTTASKIRKKKREEE